MTVSGHGVFGKALATVVLLVVCLLSSSFAAAADLSSLVTVTKSERSITDRRTMMVTTTATIKIANNSTQSIVVPIQGVFDISSAEVTVLNAIAPTSSGNPYNKYYVDLSSKVSGGSLNQGASVSFTVNLVCKSTVRYSYKVLTYGTLPAGNQAPTANAGPPQTVTLPYGRSTVNVILDGSASRDPDGTITSYTWTGSPQPAGQMKPMVSLAAGQYTFTLTVTDNQNATSQPASVTINVAKETVRLPQITVSPAPPYTTNTGATSPLNISAAASSPDGRQVTLSAAPFVTGATFNATAGLQATGTYSFLPGYGQQGKYLIIFTARDSYGLSAAQTVQIEVIKTNRPPELTLPATASVDEGKLLLIPVSATDPDGDILTLASSALPANAKFIPATGTISFIPGFDQAGSYPVTVSASDGVTSAQKTVTIKVNDVPTGGGSTPLTLTVDPVENPNFLATQRITGQVNSTGPAQPAQKTALITGLNPTGGEQGATLSINLTGDVGTYATHFAAGKSTLSFGAGITVKQFSVTGAASATAVILIDPAASTGVRQVMVTTGSETALSVNAFSVLKGTTSITGRLVDPASGQAIVGATILIQGTNITAITDTNGNFSIVGVPAGEQRLLVMAANREALVMEVNAQPNTAIVIEDLKPASTVFNPAAPPAVSLGSVVGRGITGFTPLTDKEGLKKLITDAVLLVGGSELGILDEYGNQVNPEVKDAGLLNIKSQGVERLSDSMIRGETFSLADLLFSFSNSMSWGGNGTPLTLQQWISSLQEMVNLAWNDPMNLENAMTVLIFNSGRNLLPDPPKLSPATRLNHFQAFLFTNSLFAYMKTP